MTVTWIFFEFFLNIFIIFLEFHIPGKGARSKQSSKSCEIYKRASEAEPARQKIYASEPFLKILYFLETFDTRGANDTLSI